MYRVMDDSLGHAVGIKVDGKLTKEDYKLLVPYFKKLIKQFGTLNILCEMTNFTGMTVNAFWEDLKLSMRHVSNIDRMAIVGDQRWAEWLAREMNPLAQITVRVFHADDIDQAWCWIKESTGSEASPSIPTSMLKTATSYPQS